PVGSSKSTIARLLKHGLERYSKTEEGALYTFTWTDSNNDHGLLGKGVPSFPCPMHEEPLHLIPTEIRDKVIEDLNRGSKSKTKIRVEGDLCPACRFIFRGLMQRYEGDINRVLNHIEVRRLTLSEADRIGIGTFQPKDEKNQDSTELTGDINYRRIAEYGSD